MTSSSPAAAAAATSNDVSRQSKPASSRWLRLRLYGGGGGNSGGRRILPSTLLGPRRRHTSSSLHYRDYSVDKLTDAVFHEFLRHDPLYDNVRQSPLVIRQPHAASSESVDCLTGHRQGRAAVSVAWPLSAHIEENEPDRVSGSSATRRTSSNCRSSSAASRNSSTEMITTTLCRDSSILN